MIMNTTDQFSLYPAEFGWIVKFPCKLFDPVLCTIVFVTDGLKYHVAVCAEGKQLFHSLFSIIAPFF